MKNYKTIYAIIHIIQIILWHFIAIMDVTNNPLSMELPSTTKLTRNNPYDTLSTLAITTFSISVSGLVG